MVRTALGVAAFAPVVHAARLLIALRLAGAIALRRDHRIVGEALGGIGGTALAKVLEICPGGVRFSFLSGLACRSQATDSRSGHPSAAATRGSDFGAEERYAKGGSPVHHQGSVGVPASTEK